MKAKIMKWILGIVTAGVIFAGGFWVKQYNDLEKRKQAEQTVVMDLNKKVAGIEKKANEKTGYKKLKENENTFKSELEMVQKSVSEIEYDEASQREMAQKLSNAEKNYAINLRRGLQSSEESQLTDAQNELKQLKKKTAPILNIKHLPISEDDLNKKVSDLKGKVSHLTQMDQEKSTFEAEANDLVKNYHLKVNQAKQMEKERVEKAKREKAKREKERLAKEKQRKAKQKGQKKKQPQKKQQPKKNKKKKTVKKAPAKKKSDKKTDKK